MSPDRKRVRTIHANTAPVTSVAIQTVRGSGVHAARVSMSRDDQRQGRAMTNATISTGSRRAGRRTRGNQPKRGLPTRAIAARAADAATPRVMDADYIVPACRVFRFRLRPHPGDDGVMRTLITLA